MFTRIKSAFTRRSFKEDDWSRLCDAGCHDVPRHVRRSHATESANRERIALQTMGHLR